MAVTVKDHMAFYLRFLEDVFPYMEKYHDKTGMGRVLSELTVLLENPSCGTVNDRALLLDYKSSHYCWIINNPRRKKRRKRYS